ncbi:hypothetical protein Tco_1155376 [Tanacetum coccineum]
MAALKSCPKHNMVTYLEKTNGNAEFHKIIDFLTRSSIHYALTVSHVVSTMFFEQFWMTTKSKTINNVRYITATVAGKPVSILEASIRSDLQFNNAVGINVLSNQAIFDTIQLMGNVTPLFPSMLAQPTEDEGAVSERPSETQPTPSPTHLKGSGGNHGGQSSSDRSLSGNEDGLTLQSVYDLFVSLCKQGRKPAKSEPTVHKDPVFDDLDDAMDYMETEDTYDEGTVKDNDETRVSTEDQVSTDKLKVSTDKLKVSTNKLNEGAAEPNEGTTELKDGNLDESAAPTTVFRDDETIAQFLVTMSQNKTKQKGFDIKEIKDTDRPRTTTERSILTLKPLPKIDPKDKGKKVLKEKVESDADSEGVNEVERNFAQLANDEEIARKARIEADSILAARLQEEEREKFTIKERAKLLHDTIAAQRSFLHNKELLKSEVDHLQELKIQVLYEKVKSSDENFVAIGSAEDERIIRELNKKDAGTKKADSIKEERKEEAGSRKRKLGTRKKIKSRKRRFRHGTSEDEKENDELKLCITIALNEDKEVDYEILDIKYTIIKWKTKYLGIKP